MSLYRGFQEFNFPLTEHTFAKLVGKLEQKFSYQAAAASATAVLWVATFPGLIGDLYAMFGTAPAAGESMTVDVQKNAVTMLTGLLTIGSTSVKTDQIHMQPLVDPAKNSFVIGDVITVVRAYTAGGGAAPMKDTFVYLEPSVKIY